MSKKSKTPRSKKPLLYINQPDFEAGTVPMQQIYVANKNIISEEIKENVVKEKKVNELETKTDITFAEENTEIEVVSKLEKKKKVSEMNVQEKILFFSNLPNNMPRTMCQIITNENKYTGIILSFSHEEGIVGIRAITSPEVIELNLNEIVAINVLGF